MAPNGEWYQQDSSSDWMACKLKQGWAPTQGVICTCGLRTQIAADDQTLVAVAGSIACFTA